MSATKTISYISGPSAWASIFICSIFLLTQFNVSVLSPVIPAIGDSFSLSGQSARLILSYGFAGYMVGQLVWGPVSDRINRSNIIIINLVLYMLVALSAMIVSTETALWGVYITMGFLAATFTSVGNAILKDRYQGDDYVKMVANVGVVMAAGPAIGPGLAAIIVTFANGAWQAAFLLLGLISLASVLGFSICCRYSSSKGPLRTQEDLSSSLFRNGRYFAALFSFSLPFGIVISYLAVGPYLLQQYYALPLHVLHIGFGLTTVVYLLGAVIFRVRSTVMTPVVALYMGTGIALMGAAALFVTATLRPHDAWLGLLALSLLLGGAGMVVPAGKAATMGQVDNAFGTAASVMKFVQSACAVLVSACAAVLYSAQNIIPLFLLYFGIVLLAFLGAVLLSRQVPANKSQ
ncbi:MAG: MFS transporter [Halioglobus sp.]|nr:MFS transporter [Halioglobus sp.]